MIKLTIEILSLFTGGLFGSLVGAHFKTGKIEPLISRMMSIMASFIVVFGLIGEGHLTFNRTAFCAAALIAFCIETLGQHEISKFLSKILNRKMEDLTHEKKG